MPTMPFPIDGKDVEELRDQITQMMMELYGSSVGGANIGDVFSVGSDNVLTVSVTDGLEKTGGSIGVVAGTGITVDSSGVSVTGAEAADDGVNASGDPANLAAAVTKDDFDALVTKLNALIDKLQTAGLMAT